VFPGLDLEGDKMIEKVYLCFEADCCHDDYLGVFSSLEQAEACIRKRAEESENNIEKCDPDPLDGEIAFDIIYEDGSGVNTRAYYITVEELEDPKKPEPTDNRELRIELIDPMDSRGVYSPKTAKRLDYIIVSLHQQSGYNGAFMFHNTLLSHIEVLLSRNGILPEV
jgi:hypothetical protein